MNSVKFHANEINTYTENEVLTLAFAENDLFEKYVNISFELTPSLTDKSKFGWSRYYIEVQPQNIGAYSIISSVKLSKYSLKIIFNEKGINDYEIEGIEISFDTSKYDLINSNINRIFE